MTTATESLQAVLADVFAEDLNIEVPSPDTDQLATGLLDSVGIVELLLQLEQRLGVRVENDDLDIDQHRSLSAIAALLAARVAQAHEAGGTG